MGTNCQNGQSFLPILSMIILNLRDDDSLLVRIDCLIADRKVYDTYSVLGFGMMGWGMMK